MSDDFRHQATFFHEAQGYLWFTDNGLSPYWVLGNLCIEHFDGHSEFSLELADGIWHVELTYNPDTGIEPRESDSVDGDRLYEYNLHLNGPGEKKAHFNFSPRFPDINISVPWCDSEGLNVEFQGANLSFDEYHYLLQRGLQALGERAGVDISRRYFNRIRPDSKITTVELYVRITRDQAKKLVRTNGAFYKLMHLLADERGLQWAYRGDNTEIVGKRHAFDLGRQAAKQLGPGQTIGRRFKCYHPKHVRSEETRDDPLSSPKFGVAFHKSLNANEIANDSRSKGSTIDWGERDTLLHELEESLINMLRWAGVPIAPDPTTFVADDHFEICESERDIARLEDPTPQLEAEQEHLLVKTLSDLSPSAEVLTKELATDGGQHISEAADKTGYSIRQIYRAIEELGDIVVNDNGLVQLASEKIKQDVAGIVDSFKDQLLSTADRLAHLCNIETRSAADSAIQQWMNKYGAEFVDVDGLDADGKLRFDTWLSKLKGRDYPNISEVLQEGLEAWTSSGRNAQVFEDLLVEINVAEREGYATGKVSAFH